MEANRFVDRRWNRFYGMTPELSGVGAADLVVAACPSP